MTCVILEPGRHKIIQNKTTPNYQTLSKCRGTIENYQLGKMLGNLKLGQCPRVPVSENQSVHDAK